MLPMPGEASGLNRACVHDPDVPTHLASSLFTGRVNAPRVKLAGAVRSSGATNVKQAPIAASPTPAKREARA